MAIYRIQGGVKLRGAIKPTPNKNEVLPAIVASLLTSEPVTLRNVPKTNDVRGMLKIIKKLGGKISYSDEGKTVKINSSNIKNGELDIELTKKMKAGVMFMAPLLLRFKKSFMPIPGGCKLGTRPLDAFVNGMEMLGARYTPTDKGFYLTAEKLKAKSIWPWFPSVTGTENLIMLATGIKGKTEIFNAATEPHVQQLCKMLMSMGANIEGIGSNRLIIEGGNELKGTDWTISSDHLDVIEYIASAAVTGGEIKILDAVPEHTGLIRQAFEIVGVKTYYDENTLIVPSDQELEIKTRVKGDIYDIKAFFWPLFPPDAIHSLIITALKSRGKMIFHNTFYEYGFFFVEELAKMKSNVIMADPHRLITFGPTDFRPGPINAPNIIAAAKGLFIALLSAKGESILYDTTDQLMRRYPDIVESYNHLGGVVEKIKR